MKHELKIWPQYYHRVKDGSKTFEIRKNDRDFQVGDTVILIYFDPEFIFPNPLFTEHEMRISWNRDFKPLGPYKIGYIFKLEDDRVIFSILPILNDDN